MSKHELKHFTKEEIEELQQIFQLRSIEEPATTPGTPRQFPGPKPIVVSKPECPKCGLVLESVMMYACMNAECPTGLGTLVV